MNREAMTVTPSTLRQLASTLQSFTADGSNAATTMDIKTAGDLLLMAADEIERLQEQRQRLVENLDRHGTRIIRAEKERDEAAARLNLETDLRQQAERECDEAREELAKFRVNTEVVIGSLRRENANLRISLRLAAVDADRDTP